MGNLGTDFYNIDTVESFDGSFNTLSPNEFGIGAPENMNAEPTALTCNDYIVQWCATQEGSCINVNGSLAVPTEQQADFVEAYPNCGTVISEQNSQTENTSSMESTKNPTWDINSPKFLGGNNVHNVILIVIGLLILASVTSGNLLQGIGSAVKKAV